MAWQITSSTIRRRGKYAKEHSRRQTYCMKTRLSCLVSCFLIAACQPQIERHDTTELADFAKEYAAAWSGNDPQAFALFYSESGSLRINDGEPSVGRDAIEATARGFMTAFPDMTVRLIELRHSDDHIEFHWRWTGTNSGPGGTGNAVDLRGYEEWTLDDDGLILESLGHLDDAEYQRQLNADDATSSDGASASAPDSQPCSMSWQQAVEAQLQTGDSQGHGPDVGSDEWRSVVEFKLGIRGDPAIPARDTEEWCTYIDALLTESGSQ